LPIKIDDSRLEELYRIGVDEVYYRKGHRFLTVVADHDKNGAVVWAKEGRDAETLKAFYEELGEERAATLQAVSLDLGSAYEKATTEAVPHAVQCVDPFHVVQLANKAIEEARRWAWNLERVTNRPQKRPVGRPLKGSTPPPDRPRFVKHTGWALVKDPDNLSESQREVLDRLRRERSVLYRCWQLKEGLRDLYRLRLPRDAGVHLDWWLTWASRSRIRAFVKLSKTIRTNRGQILAAIELGLSNSKLEGLNSKIRLINHRGYWAPFRGSSDLDDLFLLRRDHRPATHGKVRRTGNPPRIPTTSRDVNVGGGEDGLPVPDSGVFWKVPPAPSPRSGDRSGSPQRLAIMDP
jgi:transposase